MIFYRDVLLKFLIKLDEELSTEASLYIIGGSAASIAYDAKDGTKDIDTWSNEKNIEIASKKVIKKFKDLNIPLSSASVHIKSEEMKKRFILFTEIKTKKLKIFVPEPEDLFLLKAQRADEKDRLDLINLHKAKPLDPTLILQRFRTEILPQNPANDEMIIERYLVTISVVFGESEAFKHEALI